MSGQRRACAVMMPLSIEKVSLGRPSMFHERIATGSPSTSTSENLSEHGTLAAEHLEIQSETCWSRKRATNGPMYETTPEPMSTSPVMLLNLTPSCSDAAFHRSFSPPSPPMSFSARSSLLAQSSDCRSRSSFFCVVSSNVACSSASLSSTALSAAFFCASSADTSAYSASAFASCARLGATSLATRSYVSIARTQQHSPKAACDAFLTRSGTKASFVMYLSRIFFITSGLMLS